MGGKNNPVYSIFVVTLWVLLDHYIKIRVILLCKFVIPWTEMSLTKVKVFSVCEFLVSSIWIKYSLASLYKVQGLSEIVMSSILIMNQAYLDLTLPYTL